MLSANANAAQIEYNFSGFTTGTIGTNSFTNTSFSMSLYGDTDATYYGGSSIWYNDGSAEITLGGIGTATFITPLRMFSNNSNNAVGMQNVVTYDKLDMWSAGLAGYTLDTEIGPVTGSTWTGQWAGTETSLGLIQLSGVKDVTFTATTTVPEPSTIVLFVTGFSGLAFCRRKRS